MKIFLKTLLITVITLLSTQLSAQINESSFLTSFNKALDFFQKGLYESAEKELNTIISPDIENKIENQNLLSEIFAYKALCNIELKRKNYESSVLEFNKKFPYSTLREYVNFRYASALFDEKEYLRAYPIFNSISKYSLNKEQLLEYFFKLGYCNIKMGEMEKAYVNFSEILYRPKSFYTSPAQYYTAYIHYIKKEFPKAIEKFSPLVDDSRFSVLAKYYLLESEFMMGNHNYVVKQGEDVYNLVNKEYKPKSARIISESFFALNRPEEAKFYFEKYSIYSNDLTRNDYYYSGIISYTLKGYFQAIESLNHVTSIDDSLSQNAFYHIANSYIQLKNKQKAFESFKIAASKDFDKVIKEESYYNVAKLAFDLNGDVSIFDEYIRSFSPSTEKMNEIKTYVAVSYINKNDFKSASEVLKEIKNPELKQKQLLQRSLFLRAMELINMNALRESESYLQEAMSLQTANPYLSSLANFWLAEVYYRDNRYKQAAELNNILIAKGGEFKTSKEYKLAQFNLAYSHYRLNNFEQARLWFEKYVSETPTSEPTHQEALYRIGDCLFNQKFYEDALKFYGEVSDKSSDIYLYSNYKSAIVLGLLGRDVSKIDFLTELIKTFPSSILVSDLKYELGRTLVQKGDNPQAINLYKDIIANHKNTQFYPKALIEMGLISRNDKNEKGAIEYYTKVIEETPTAPEVQDAIAGLESIYQESGKFEEFLALLEKSGVSGLRTSTEKELMIFNTGEKQYLAGNLQNAINTLSNYIKTYPEGAKLSSAWFYIGDSYKRLNKPESALEAFESVIKIGENSFVELAILYYAQISYTLQRFNQAYDAYTKLESVAKLENNVKEAEIGKFVSLFSAKRYNEVIEQIASVDLNIFSEIQKRKLNLIFAKSYFLSGKREIAIPKLKTLAKFSNFEEGAESYYLLVKNSFDSGDFKETERVVFEFARTETPHRYWLAKSYIILADSYIEKGENQAAKATLESILNTYKPSVSDDIQPQIMNRLNKIK